MNKGSPDDFMGSGGCFHQKLAHLGITVGRSCGIDGVHDITDKAALDDFARLIHTADRTLFARIAIQADEPPRVLPSRDGVLLKNRFRHALGVE